ncbi:peptidase family M20/M25/M40 [Thozetella sp. PMI_491]|nr:peptidase family M20/M25/M40 [Thozetella sp. PMI_491]
MHLVGFIPLCAAVAAAAGAVPPTPRSGSQHVIGAVPAPSSFDCELPPVAAPPDDGFPSARELFGTKEALLKQVKRHTALVNVPSICYDDLGDFDEDPRWQPFYDFHDVLVEVFPTLHSRMKREKINRFGLLYTLEGSDKSLKPLMLTAHQDVVPVADASTWTHPPFDAYFDGTWLWGRGASDDKNSLTALMSALESLLSKPGWTPKRTVILAFGFDEECSGVKGAGSIARHLESVYGEDSMVLVLDEGGMGLQLIDDVLYALPATTEKGHIDVWLELHVTGGHSSIPFPHTGIGIISEIVSTLESNPYEAKLIEGSPIHNHLVCQARYSPDAQPELTELIEKGDLKALAQELAILDRASQFRIQTSQSVDMISGGQKINAMPEVTRLGVNYRVAPHNSIQEVQSNVLKYIEPIVKKYSLKVSAFEGEDCCEDLAEELYGGYRGGFRDGVKVFWDVDYNGTLVLSSKQRTQNAPVSPTSGAIWDLFSGTLQHSYRFDGGKVVPVGELMTGNTDTRHYLGLTRNVYRFTPVRQGGNANAHTINEGINMTNHVEAIQFYYDLIRNFDVSDV